MTSEHNSLKTLFQNTGIVKSINRGLFERPLRDTVLSSQFNNPVNVDKCVLILNFSDASLTNTSNGIMSSISTFGSGFSNVKITSTQISVNASPSTQYSNGGMLYWQVIEFY